MKILIIEDDTSLREIMTRSLEAEKYIVETASDFSHAIEKVSVYEYDCILLDIMLPDGNGLDILNELVKQEKQNGVIIISAKDSIDDRVTGLELGADDYLVKPFHLPELHARIRSILRRKFGNKKNIELYNISINPDKRTVCIDGNNLSLSRKEYDLLLYFVTHYGHILSKEQIAEAVWGDYIDQCDNYDFIYAQIKNLRHKLDTAKSGAVIKAIYGFGYKIVERQ